ncbi:MAG: AsmA family protein, partial [Gammaproteobacteria bacterium]|nr:AsmA family protein [Gammaproteobacteria bacterium]
LRFDLVSQNLDVDALLGTPPPSATSGPGTDAPQQSEAQAPEDVKIELPVKLLRELDIDGKLGIAQMKAQNLHMQDVSVAIKAQNGLVGLKPLTLKMYGGEVETAVVIDVKFSTPKYGINESVKGVQVGDLLKDYSGEERVSGSLDAEANLTTNGEWVSELKKNSNGSLRLAFLDGALNGFNIRHSIDSAKAKVRGKEPPSKEELKTDFSSLTLSGEIKRGVFTSDDLDLQAPLLRVGGRGSADLNTETVDYLVEAKLVGTVEGQQGETADELAGLNIPVSVKGPFADPKIDVLLDEMLKSKANAEKDRIKAEIKQQKEALKQQLEAEKKALEANKKIQKQKDKAKSKLEDKLNKLFD